MENEYVKPEFELMFFTADDVVVTSEEPVNDMGDDESAIIIGSSNSGTNAISDAWLDI